MRLDEGCNSKRSHSVKQIKEADTLPLFLFSYPLRWIRGAKVLERSVPAFFLKTAAVAFMLVFSFSVLSADVITHKNGKKYSGFITEYSEGKFYILVKGKKYPIKESDIVSIVWDADEDQVAEAYKDEPPIRSYKSRRENRFYAAVMTEWIVPFERHTTNAWGGSLFLPYVVAGITTEKYFTGVGYTQTQTKGKVEYSSDYIDLSGVSEIERELNFLMLTFTNFFGRDYDVPFAILFRMDIGGVKITESVKNYPVNIAKLGMQEYPILYEDIARDYFGIFAGLLAGISYTLFDRLCFTAFAGYKGFSANYYIEPADLNGETEMPFENMMFFGGLSAGAGVSYAF